ncbi:MAG: HD domain-containing protein [Nanoarchaeota archaeon]|nr:HD domain-containing protein [Nanoarchaeota archaeon]
MKTIKSTPLQEINRILNEILLINVRPSIKKSKNYIENCFENNNYLIGRFSDVNGNPQKAFKLLEEYDYHTAQHGIEVREMSMNLSKHMDKEFDENLLDAALLHDIGKAPLPKEVLYKEKFSGERLTKEEKRKIRTHPIMGESIGIIAKLHPSIVYAAAAHHDYKNGRGYPHINPKGIIEMLVTLYPDIYKESLDKQRIIGNTNLITLCNDMSLIGDASIISVADMICATIDPNRKEYQKKYTKSQLYNILLKRLKDGFYEKNTVRAYLRHEGKKDTLITKIFEIYGIK